MKNNPSVAHATAPFTQGSLGLRKPFLCFTGRLTFRKTLFPGDDFALRCINRDSGVQAPPAARAASLFFACFHKKIVYFDKEEKSGFSALICGNCAKPYSTSLF